MNYIFPWYYKVLDLPVLPVELEQQLWQQYHAPDREQFAISTNKFLHPSWQQNPIQEMYKDNGTAKHL